MDASRPAGPSSLLVAALLVSGLLLAGALPVPPALARWLALAALGAARLAAVDWRRPSGSCAAGALVLAAAFARGATPAEADREAPADPHTRLLVDIIVVALETPVLRDPLERRAKQGDAGAPAPRSLFRARVLRRGARIRADEELRVFIHADAREIRPGDVLRARGRLLPARWPGLPGVRRPRELLPTVSVPSAKLLRHARAPGGLTGSWLDRAVWTCRGAAHETVVSLYSESARGAMLAMLLGDRRDLDRELRDDLQRAGAAHFLAISGLHAGLVLALLLRVPLPRPARFALRLGLLVAFALVTGAKPPVMRATLMLGLALAASEASRVARPLDALAWTVFIVLAWEPAWLGDLGFQLSTLAVLGILTWTPRLEALPAPASSGGWAPPPTPATTRRPVLRAGKAALAAARTSIAVSIAASLATAPLVLATFQRIHPLSPLWNLLLYPPVALALVAGFASVAIGMVSTTAAAPLAWLAELGLDIVRKVAGAAADVPGSCIDLPAPPLAVTIMSTALLLAPVPRVAASRALRRATTALAAIVIAALAVGLRVTRTPAEGADLWTFDVGAGSSHLLISSGGTTILVDVGSRDRVRFAGENVAAALLALGVTHLDAIVVTHKDADHVNGLEAVLERVSAGGVWASPLFDRFEYGHATLETLRARGVVVHRLNAGDILRAGTRHDGWTLRAIQPVATDGLPYLGDSNESSLVLEIERQSRGGTTRRALLTADIEVEGVARLLAAERPLGADVLVLPHHGAKNRLLEELIQRTSPGSVIISASRTRSATRIRERLRARGIEVLATWEEGSVRVRLER